MDKERDTEYYIEPNLKKNLKEKLIPSLLQKDKDFFMVIDGREGCLTSDTLIKTSKGDFEVKDLANGKAFTVESLDIETGKVKQNKAIAFKTGEKEVFEIETEDGRKIKATANHTFFVFREGKVYEVKLSELKEGDELICK